MDRQQVITVLESLANGIDPATGTRLPHRTFHHADTVRALFAASALLKTSAAPNANQQQQARERRTAFSSAGMAWTAEEDAQLGQEFDSGLTIAQIALRHRRTSGAITSRLVKLGRLDAAVLKPHEPKPRLVS